MTTEMNLGERLQARLTREQQDKLEKLQREVRELDGKAQRELQLVVDFFERCKKQTTDAILAERSLPCIMLGKRENTQLCSVLATYRWNDPNNQIDVKQHRYFPVWEKFAAWATENGLHAGWRYEWDGGGIESWHILEIVPLAQWTDKPKKKR